MMTPRGGIGGDGNTSISRDVRGKVSLAGMGCETCDDSVGASARHAEH